MRTLALLLTFVPASLLTAQEKITSKKQLEASAEIIKALQKGRIEALKAAADTSRTLAHHARIDVCDAAKDRLTLLKAELEGTETESDRIRLYTKAQDDLKDYAKLAIVGGENARGTEMAVLKNKAVRLEIELALQKVNVREKPSSKVESPKIRDLKNERIAVLKDLLAYLTTQFQNARAQHEEVLEAQMMLLNAELDAAEKESDRIEIYEKTIAVLKRSEELADARWKAARATVLPLQRSRARRLEVEILLEKALMKEGKGGGKRSAPETTIPLPRPVRTPGSGS